ncbi:hypothetical protein V6N12_043082 [Hibiscus sabdariffa]|uniref:Uncharacterized protein n=1 Tax=Hibiscus sabdariffa TaxID=183260 RepID=A0ABR2DI57_9ROSI
MYLFLVWWGVRKLGSMVERMIWPRGLATKVDLGEDLSTQVDEHASEESVKSFEEVVRIERCGAPETDGHMDANDDLPLLRRGKNLGDEEFDSWGETEPNVELGHFLLLKRELAKARAWLVTLPCDLDVSSKFSFGSISSSSFSVNPSIDVGEISHSELEVPTGIGPWVLEGNNALAEKRAKIIVSINGCGDHNRSREVTGILTPSFLLTTLVWMTYALKVSSVLVMQSTGSEELLSSSASMARASVVQVTDLVKNNAKVHSSFHGACYVEATRLTVDAVSALDR